MKTPEELAREAGFKVFGSKIVAGDGGSSGLATDSVARLIALARAEGMEAAAKVCEAEDVAPTDSPVGVQECIAASIRRALKESL